MRMSAGRGGGKTGLPRQTSRTKNGGNTWPGQRKTSWSAATVWTYLAEEELNASVKAFSKNLRPGTGNYTQT
jgi:hypothetical protein